MFKKCFYFNFIMAKEKMKTKYKVISWIGGGLFAALIGSSALMIYNLETAKREFYRDIEKKEFVSVMDTMLFGRKEAREKYQETTIEGILKSVVLGNEQQGRPAGLFGGTVVDYPSLTFSIQGEDGRLQVLYNCFSPNDRRAMRLAAEAKASIGEKIKLIYINNGLDKVEMPSGNVYNWYREGKRLRRDWD